MKNYSNPIEEYDEKAVKAWHVADALQAELDAGVERSKWSFGGSENYEELKGAVIQAIKDLKAIY